MYCFSDADYRAAKATMVAYMDQGYPWNEAASMAGVVLSRASAYRLWLRSWRDGPSCLDDGRHGHPSKLRDPIRHWLRDTCTRAPSTPARLLQTTFADDWLDRVAVHRLAERATAWLTLRIDGVHVEREGLPDLYLPFAAVRSAEPGDALAGAVVGAGGLLLVDWELGDRLLTTGFRADDHAEHRRLASAIAAHLPVQEAS
jgi:transposase